MVRTLERRFIVKGRKRKGLHLHNSERKDTKKSDLQANGHLETHERPEWHGQDSNISDDYDAVIRIVEGNIVNAGSLIVRCPVEGDGIALKERYAEYGNHGAGVDSLESIDGVPDRLLDAYEFLVEAEDRRLDESEDGVIQ